MDSSTNYTKTGRGLRAQIKKLPPNAGQILFAMNTTSSGGELHSKLRKMNIKDFDLAISWLIEGGYIRVVSREPFSNSVWAPVTQSAIQVSEISFDEFNQTIKATIAEAIEALVKTNTVQPETEAISETAAEAETKIDDPDGLGTNLNKDIESKIESSTKADAIIRLNAQTDNLLKADEEAHERAKVQAKGESDAKSVKDAKAITEEKTESETKKSSNVKAAADALAKADAEARERAEAQVRLGEKEKLAKEAKAEAIEKAAADALAKADAEARERAEAQAKLKEKESLAREAKAEAIEKAEAEAKAFADAKAVADAEAQARTKAEAEKLAKADAEARERAEAQAKLKEKESLAREAKAKAEAIEKAEAEAKAFADAKAVADAQAKADAEERERAEAQTKLEAEAKAAEEAKEKAELAAKAIAAAKVEADKKEKAEAKAKAKALARAEMIAKAEAIEKARLETEAREKAEAEAKTLAEAKVQAEVDARKLAERRAIEEAEAQARAEEAARIKDEAKAEAFATARAIAHAKAEEKAKKAALRKASVNNFKANTAIKLKSFTKASEKKLKQAINLKKLKKARKQWQTIFFLYLKKLFVYSTFLAILLIAIAHFVNLSMFVKPVESFTSANTQSEISIEAVHVSLFPKVHLTLQNVIFGDKNGPSAKNIFIYPDVSALIEKVKKPNTYLQTPYEIKSIEIAGLTLQQKDLAIASSWIGNISQHKQLKINQILLSKTIVQLQGLDLPMLNGNIDLNNDGLLKDATISTDDNNLTIDIEQVTNNYRFNIKGAKWRSPLSPNLVFSEITANGSFDNNTLTIQQINGYLYDGKLSANMVVDFSTAWQAKGDFILSEMNLNSMSNDIKLDSVLEGNLTSNANFSFKYNTSSNTIEDVTANLRFKINDGQIKKVDLIEAMRSNNLGGTTHFDELSGSLSLNNKEYEFKNLTLQDKQLQAYGGVNIGADRTVSADIYTKIPLKSNPIKSHLLISGTIDTVKLKK